MKILQILTQYGTRSLDRTFSYLYAGKKAVAPRYRVRINFNGHPAMGFILGIVETDKTPKELEEENDALRARLGMEARHVRRVEFGNPDGIIGTPARSASGKD